MGLKIVDLAKFNQFFSCGEDVSLDDLTTQVVYSKKDAVMFIPSNQREGEPLHLYRRLQQLQKQVQPPVLADDQDSPEQQIIRDIDAILSRVHQVISSGIGLTKEQLQEQIMAADQCLKN